MLTQLGACWLWYMLMMLCRGKLLYPFKSLGSRKVNIDYTNIQVNSLPPQQQQTRKPASNMSGFIGAKLNVPTTALQSWSGWRQNKLLVGLVEIIDSFWAVLQSPFPFSFKPSKHHYTETVSARELKVLENVHPLPHVTCPVSGLSVTCQVSSGMYHASGGLFLLKMYYTSIERSWQPNWEAWTPSTHSLDSWSVRITG